MEKMDTPSQRSEKIRVLLVDDEFHVRTILKEILVNLGCEVVGEATTGVEAVDLFRTLEPDLMILDITMPQLSGEEVLMLIMAEYPDAIVIILTSMTDENTVNSCLDLGAVNYIRKDTPIEEIKQVLRETLNYYCETGEVEPG